MVMLTFIGIRQGRVLQLGLIVQCVLVSQRAPPAESPKTAISPGW
jgi:hypothetical protein